MCPHRPQQVHLPVYPRQPQRVLVLQQQQFTRHIQVQAQVFLQRPH